MVFVSKRKSRAAFLAILIYVLIVVLAVCVAIFIKNPTETVENKDEYEWIVSDPAAVDGMLDGSYYKGEKNSAGTLSYKIAEEITADSTGKGNFKIENSGKNTCLIKVSIFINSEKVYESGYLKPNQHINEDTFDKVISVGTYIAQAVFEGYDPNTEESIGSTSTAVKITFAE